MQTFTCENTLESHPWFANKFNNIQEHEHIVYMRFTRLGIFYKNTHYFFTGTKTDLNNFMLERKKEIDEAKKEVGFGRGDHDNLWDTPLSRCSHWYLFSYTCEEEFKSALHQLENQTHKDRINNFPDEIIYINQINK